MRLVMMMFSLNSLDCQKDGAQGEETEEASGRRKEGVDARFEFGQGCRM